VVSGAGDVFALGVIALEFLLGLSLAGRQKDMTLLTQFLEAQVTQSAEPVPATTITSFLFTNLSLWYAGFILLLDQAHCLSLRLNCFHNGQ
jgi:hypothetical protein